MSFDVYLEVGKKRTFAGALDWPGWSRSGPGEEAALASLLAYAPRYARVLEASGLAFAAPPASSAFTVIEKLQGDATTDFGAPHRAPAYDALSVNANDLERLQILLEACWQAFDAALHAAAGKDLRKGPRGGGRDLDIIARHVHDAEMAYLRQLGGKTTPGQGENMDSNLQDTRQVILDTLAASARGEIPPLGPRGGQRWTTRYFVRRAAWHILDHAWEIEDRIIPGD